MVEIISKQPPWDERIREHMRRAQEGRKKHLEDWRSDWRLYQSFVDMTGRDTSRSNMFVPLVYPLVEAAAARYVAGIVGSDPLVSVMPGESTDYETAWAHQLALQYYYEKMGIVVPMVQAIKGMLIFGDSFGLQRWRTEYRTKQTTQPIMEMGFQVGQEDVEVPELVYDGPWIDIVQAFQVYSDGGSNIDRCKMVVVEQFFRRSELEDMQAAGQIENVEKIGAAEYKSSKSASDEMDRFSLYKDVGYATPEDQDDMVRVWMGLRDDALIWMANNEVVILDVPNPHAHGRKPLVQFPYNPNVEHFYSISSVRPVARLQHLYNTLWDQIMDRNSQTIDPWVLYAADSGLDADLLQQRNHNFLPVEGDPSRSVWVQEVGQLSGDVMGILNMVKTAFDEVSGFSGYQRGSPNIPKATATRDEGLRAEGNERIRYTLNVFDSHGMRRQAELMGSDVIQFMPEKIEARIAGPMGPRMRPLAASEIKGQFDYRYLGSTSAYNREVDRAQIMEASNLVTNFPELNRGGLLEIIVDSIPAFRGAKDKLILPVQPGAPAGGPPQGQPGGPGQPPGPGGGRPGAPVQAGQGVANPKTFKPTTRVGQLLGPAVRSVRG